MQVHHSSIWCWLLAERSRLPAHRDASDQQCQEMRQKRRIRIRKKHTRMRARVLCHISKRKRRRIDGRILK